MALLAQRRPSWEGVPDQTDMSILPKGPVLGDLSGGDQREERPSVNQMLGSFRFQWRPKFRTRDFSMGLWDSLRRFWSATVVTDGESGGRGPALPPKAGASSFSVLLPPVDGDESGRLLAEIRDALGGSSGLRVVLSEEGLGAGADQDADSTAFGEAVRKARRLMKQANCQVLVWADVKEARVCRVRFIPCQMKSDRASGELLSGDLIDLPVPMGTTSDLVLGGVLAAFHLMSDHDRRERFEKLRGSVSASEFLLQKTSLTWPSGGKTKAGLLYAAMLTELGFSAEQRPMLERAVDLYRQALGEDMGQALLPPVRAAALVHFADLQAELGHQDGDEAVLTAAVHAYRLAAPYYTMQALPEEYANLMNQMGRTLQQISQQTNRTSHMKEAAEAYLAATQVWTAGGEPERWAELQYRVGTMLSQIAEFSGNADVAQRSVDFFKAAAGIWSRERDPRRWANLMNNVGAVRFAQGKRSGETAQLREAIECFSHALEVYQAHQMSRNVHVTQKNIARVDRVIAAQGETG